MTLGWEDIRAEVLRRIRARDWPPGALIPGEEALAEEFGVARATVNRALRDLAESRGDWNSAGQLCELADFIGVGQLRLATVTARVDRIPLS